jgi:endonuclease/exonuclease/phosphatase family metal-dependent hydrolase
MKIRALTYNIHKGFCYYSRKYVLENLKAAIKSADADVVFLQEVMGVHPAKQDNFAMASQFEYLADSLWPHFAYGKNAAYDSGHHGNAILSRFPLVQHSNINISTNPFEQRGILHAEVDIEGTPLHLFCLHLDLLERGRMPQMQQLREEVLAKTNVDHPVIVAGDFNDWRQRLSLELPGDMNFSEVGNITHGAHHKTFPSALPFWAMDRIYVRGLKVLESGVLSGSQWRKLSDHLPLVAVLTGP